MAGYAMEIRNAGLQLRIASRNPSILERIFIVNKLLKTRRLVICKSAKRIVEGLKLRQFDKLGKPEKGAGEDSPCHIDDSLEYVIWRIVMSDPDYKDFKTFTGIRESA